MNAGNERVRRDRRVLVARPLPISRVDRVSLILREGVQDVGQHQLLMLLFVVKTDLDGGEDRLTIRR